MTDKHDCTFQTNLPSSVYFFLPWTQRDVIMRTHLGLLKNLRHKYNGSVNREGLRFDGQPPERREETFNI